MNDARGRSAAGPSDQELSTAVPRERGGREVRLGVFVILGLLSFVFILFLLTDPAAFRGRYFAVTLLENAGGVRPGDPVQMRGVNIGRVAGFDMLPDGQVALTMELEGEWALPEGSIATLAASGIFGGRTVEILPGPGPELVEPWDTIPGTGGGGDLMTTAGDVGAQAGQVLTRLSAILEEPTVTGVRGSVQELEALLRELRALTVTQRAELAELTASLNRSAEGLEAAAAAGPDAARAIARADSALLQLNETAATLEQATESLATVLQRLEAGEGTLGRLSTDEALYENLNDAAAQFAQLVEDIRANPRRYLTVEVF